MSIESQIEAAWKEYKPEALSTNSMALSHDVFAAGYRAALRGIYREVEIDDMVVGRSYWVGGMIGEMQGFEVITGSDGVTRKWPVISGYSVCPMLFAFRGPIPNGSDFPDPSEVFGEEGV